MRSLNISKVRHCERKRGNPYTVEQNGLLRRLRLLAVMQA